MNPMLPPDAVRAFNHEFNAKFLATVGPDSEPNLALIASMTTAPAPGDGDLVFGQLMMQKTRRNLDLNPRVGFLVIDQRLRVWTGIGDVTGSSVAGPDMDRLNDLGFIRYNAYTGFAAAFRMRVRRINEFGALSQLGLLLSQVGSPGRAALRQAWDGRGLVPPQVMEKFLRVKAVKVLSWVGADGYPACAPLSGAGFPGLDQVKLMLPSPGLAEPPAPGAPLALGVVTMDPMAYQLRAETLGASRNRVRARITRAYSGSPPLPGEDLTAVRLLNQGADNAATR